MPQRKPGRPKDEQKHQDVLRAAKDVMLEVGFEGAAIEVIATKAGVSKATIYRVFGDKEKLLEAVIDLETSRLEALALPMSGDEPIRSRLVRIGLALTEVVLHPSHLAFETLLSQSARQYPKVASVFYAKGPARFKSLLTMMLSDAKVELSSTRMTYDEAAEHLMSLFLGLESMEIRMAVAKKPYSNARRLRIEQAVDLVLRVPRERKPG